MATIADRTPEHNTRHSSTLHFDVTFPSLLKVLGLGFVAYFLWQLQEVVMTLFLALILMSALKPAVFVLEHRLRLPRMAAILFCYCGILLFFSLISAVIVPPLVREFPTLISTLNLPPIPDDFLAMNFSLSEVSAFAQQFFSSFGAVFRVVTSTFNGIFAFFTVLVMASYLLLQREDLYKKVGWFTTNPRHFRIAREVLDRVSDQLGGWVRGEIVLMTTIGVMTYLGLLLFDLPYVLPLAFLAGFLEILPNLGPTIAAVPAVIIAFVTHGPVVAAFVLLLYVIVQQLENNFIVPKIMKDNVDVSPLMTIVVILSGFKLGSIMGALLAVPIYVTARTLYSVWLRETRREHTKGEPTSRK